MHKSGYSRTLIKQMLSLYMGISEEDIILEKKEHGKPFLVTPPEKKALFFNLSHTEGYLVAAFSTVSEVGIDIERQDRTVHLETISRRFFHPSEKKEFLHYNNDSNKKKHFMSLWTLKEAFLKGLGTGLTVSPSSFLILPNTSAGTTDPFVTYQVQCSDALLSTKYATWTLMSVPAPEGYVCSLAYQNQ